MPFYYRSNNETRGPVSLEELTELFNQGVIREDSLVVEQGAGAWSTYRGIVPAPEPEPEPGSEPEPEPAPSPSPAPKPATSPSPMPSAMPKPAAIALNQAVASLGQVQKSLGKARPALDLVQKGAFLFGYILSLFLLLAAVVALVITGCNYLFSSGVEKPDTADFLERVEHSSSYSSEEKKADTTKLKNEVEEAMREVCQDLGLDDLKKLTEMMADQVVRRVKKENIDTWLDGWEDCVNEAADFCDDNGLSKEKKEKLCAEATDWYANNFRENSSAPEEKLMYLLIALVALMLTLPIPALLRIERNTRCKDC